jgi:hypothetical protein
LVWPDAITGVNVFLNNVALSGCWKKEKKIARRYEMDGRISKTTTAFIDFRDW